MVPQSPPDQQEKVQFFNTSPIDRMTERIQTTQSWEEDFWGTVRPFVVQRKITQEGLQCVTHTGTHIKVMINSQSWPEGKWSSFIIENTHTVSYVPTLFCWNNQIRKKATKQVCVHSQILPCSSSPQKQRSSWESGLWFHKSLPPGSLHGGHILLCVAVFSLLPPDYGKICHCACAL